MEYLGYILLAITILLVMVLIHELGHYTAAKILGFTVNEFAVGFGPKLFGKRRKNGELFSLRALPLGGFCAFYGDAEDDDQTPPTIEPEQKKAEIQADTAAQVAADVHSDADAYVVDSVTRGKSQTDDSEKEDLLALAMRSDLGDKSSDTAPDTVEQLPVRYDSRGNIAIGFYAQKPWKRIIVLLGGVVFNFLSAIIFSLIYIWVVGYPVPMVGEVYNNPQGEAYSPFKVGDVILAVDGNDLTVMKSYSDYSKNFKSGQTVTFKVKRDGKIIEVVATRQNIVETDKNGKVSEYQGFGIATGVQFVGSDGATAFKYCVPYTFKLSWAILGSFGQLVTGKVPLTSVTGPVGSVKLMADISIANWRNILILLPLLASNLAMFNILPFPALDGAQIIFTGVEWVRKKPLKRKIQGIINAVGLGVLLLFVLIVDILSFAL